jgi:hypothetical protein
MKTILSAIILACMLVIVSECENLATLVISKLAAMAVLVLCERLFVRYCMTDEELNEKV